MTETESLKLIDKCKIKLQPLFEKLDKISLICQKKVLNAFQKNKVALRHFNPTSGYGYDDEGRDNLKRVYRDVFNCESAVVSPNIVSGTHAISLALFAIVNKGDRVLAISGMPYDTIRGVIFGDKFSLKSLDVTFDYVNLTSEGKFDFDSIKTELNKKTDVLYIQRSRGYDERESLSVYAIKGLVDFVKKLGYSGKIFVDNCYGEFVEDLEPTDVGVDLIAGSLIKNIGGGIAPSGGYVAGRKDLCDNVEALLTTNTIAGEVGSYMAGYRTYYQGLFMAPHTVNQALKGSLLIGACLSELGYQTIPKAYNEPYDITRSIRLGSEKRLVDFIQSVQTNSPVDSYVSVMPWEMPGYDEKVCMAAGCFIQGSSIELSCDAPIKEPYIAYIQGGLTFEHCVLALIEILKKL